MAGATRSKTITASVGVFVLVVAGASWWFAGGSPANRRPPASPGAAYAAILHADEDGAVLRVDGTLRGVTRDGDLVWADAGAGESGADAVCATTCPNVVVSSSIDSLNAPSASDPQPITIGETNISAASLTFSGVKNHILAVSSGSVVRIVSEQGDSFLLQTVVGSSVRSSIEVPSYDVIWLPTEDGTQAVAQLYGRRSGIAVQAYELRRGVWVRVGPLRVGRSHMSCVSGSGDLLLDRPLRLISTAGETQRWPSFPAGGFCQFYRGGAVTAQFTQTTTAGEVTNGSVVTSSNLRGHVVWSHDYASEVRLAAGTSTQLFAVIAEDVLTVRRPDGTVTKTYPEVDDAAFVADGSLVILSSDGSICWCHP